MQQVATPDTGNVALLTNPGTADTPETAVRIAAVTPAAVTPTSNTDLVVTTGLRRIKLETAKLPVFDRVDLCTDVEDWLEPARENCVYALVDKTAWVMYASGHFDKAPKEVWQARRKEARMTGTVDQIMQWENFAEWCRRHSAVQDRTKLAFKEISCLRQTGTVQKYLSKFNVLSLQAGLTEAQKLMFWYEGLKVDIRNKTELDPLTKQRMTSLQDAQDAAVAVDGFYSSNTGTAGNASTAGTGNTVGNGRKHGFDNNTDVGPSAATAMDCDRARKRFNFSRGPKGVSKPTKQPNGSMYFPHEGTVKSADIPAAVADILSKIHAGTLSLPDHLTIPPQLAGMASRTAQAAYAGFRDATRGTTGARAQASSTTCSTTPTWRHL